MNDHSGAYRRLLGVQKPTPEVSEKPTPPLERPKPDTPEPAQRPQTGDMFQPATGWQGAAGLPRGDTPVVAQESPESDERPSEPRPLDEEEVVQPAPREPQQHGPLDEVQALLVRLNGAWAELDPLMPTTLRKASGAGWATFEETGDLGRLYKITGWLEGMARLVRRADEVVGIHQINDEPVPEGLAPDPAIMDQRESRLVWERQASAAWAAHAVILAQAGVEIPEELA